VAGEERGGKGTGMEIRREKREKGGRALPHLFCTIAYIEQSAIL